METLKSFSKFEGRSGPLVLVIMDGIGLNPNKVGNAVAAAYTPTLDMLMEKHLHTQLQAHGLAVGLPSNQDMGNSEVGHNALGAGRVFDQGARLVNRAIETGALWNGAVWKKLIGHCRSKKSTLHFIGLFSDGNVHSHIDHLKAMILQAKKEGSRSVRVHILLDGRDVGERSALEYVVPFESFLSEINRSGLDYVIASGGGRMVVTMDRYEADWNIVKRGWEAHVHGNAETFSSAEKAIQTFRDRDPSVTDQFLPPFVIEKDGKPVGPIQNGDSVILFNFRGDRAIEISRAFEEKEFNKFDRNLIPQVEYAGMMEYDGDLHIPKQYLVEPPAIDRTMGQLLSNTGVKQLAISETQKYGHVTYFYNGNWSGKFNEEMESFIEIPSDQVPFEQRPWMKCAEITDRTIEEIKKGEIRFVRLNYANGDMVGHTGFFQAAVIAVESVDLSLSRLLKVVKELKGIVLVTADHGNSDEMFEMDKEGKPKRNEKGDYIPKTSHTLNPVPFIIYDPLFNHEYRLAPLERRGLSNIAATCIRLLGYVPPGDYDPSLIEFVE
ncbi:2,3-bisphosphoglycerate-independent phosphoglycerate mutase [bacterium]|nr:2,3-bisphosphoglycerate-independent phosphoglycerate mutase [bacterium]RQV93273.1 MAG: 2,3-bisphosphoglycerate-independent phosphoglycerate mutase [bacterium]